MQQSSPRNATSQAHDNNNDDDDNATTSSTRRPLLPQPQAPLPLPLPLPLPQPPALSYQGVLWKRREVFKNRWRPRWFILQPTEGILTYYLLSSASSSSSESRNHNHNHNHNNHHDNTSAASSAHVRSRTWTAEDSLASTGSLGGYGAGAGAGAGAGRYNYSNNSSNNNSNNNIDSEPFVAETSTTATARIHAEQVHYDVVPRGAFYLGGCTCTIQDSLSKPADHLYAFAIRTTTTTTTAILPSSSSAASTMLLSPSAAWTALTDTAVVYLATRTPEARQMWVQRIQRICQALAIQQQTQQQQQQQQQEHNHQSQQQASEIFQCGLLLSPLPSSAVASRDPAPVTNGNIDPSRNQQQQQQQDRDGGADANERDLISQHSFSSALEEEVLDEVDPMTTKTTTISPPRFHNDLPLHVYADEMEEEDAADPSGVRRIAPVQQQQQQQQLGWDTRWVPLGSDAEIFAQVPIELMHEIKRKLQQHLPFCDNSKDANRNDYDNNQQHATGVAVGSEGSPEWKPIFEDTATGHAAYQCKYMATRRKQQSNGSITSTSYQATLIKSVAILPHSPVQILALILDPSRRCNFESNLRHQQRMSILNPHVSLDYYAFQAVWPTSARDFTVAVHWQLLQHRYSGEKAIVTVSFSCPEAEQLRGGIPRHHVRATLFCSMYLMRQARGGVATSNLSLSSSQQRCHVTRLLSFDLAAPGGAGSSAQISQVVASQQANLLAVISNYLQREEPVPEHRFCDPLTTNQALVQSILGHGIVAPTLPPSPPPLPIVVESHRPSSDSSMLPHAAIVDNHVASVRRRLTFSSSATESGSTNDRDSLVVVGNDEDGHNNDEIEDDDDMEDILDTDHDNECIEKDNILLEDITLPSLEIQTLILLFPVILYHVCKRCNVSVAAAAAVPMFFVAAYAAIRHVVLLHLGTMETAATVRTTTNGNTIPVAVEPLNETAMIDLVTCHFSVDLKGILRFIANKREEREELQHCCGAADVSVIHILASAVAKALKNEHDLRRMRISIPWLMIDQIVDLSTQPVSVSVSENGGGIITLYKADTLSVQQIADDMDQAERQLDVTHDVGQCLILATATTTTTTNDNQSNIEIDARPVHPNVLVVAVVGDIRLERSDTHQNHRDRNGSIRTTMSMSSSSIPVTNSGSNIVGSCMPRPMLSVSLTIRTNQPSDLGACRRYAEEVRKLLQFPEMCDC